MVRRVFFTRGGYVRRARRVCNGKRLADYFTLKLRCTTVSIVGTRRQSTPELW